MNTRKSNDYKITTVNYYLVEDKTQEGMIFRNIVQEITLL